jgi:hypothetical protein
MLAMLMLSDAVHVLGRWRWAWSRPQAIARGTEGGNGAFGGGGGTGAAMERAGSSADGGGGAGGGANFGSRGLSTTPTNFPGMHAVRRSADGSGGDAPGRPAEALSQVGGVSGFPNSSTHPGALACMLPVTAGRGIPASQHVLAVLLRMIHVHACNRSWWSRVQALPRRSSSRPKHRTCLCRGAGGWEL